MNKLYFNLSWGHLISSSVWYIYPTLPFVSLWSCQLYRRLELISSSFTPTKITCFIFASNCCSTYLNVERILSSLKDAKACENHDNTSSLPGDDHKGSQSNSSRISQFLPTSRRIVQFSNGKVSLVCFSELYCQGSKAWICDHKLEIIIYGVFDLPIQIYLWYMFHTCISCLELKGKLRC